ncbi:hypothetical protein Clacol_006858 [Clathrus columnatus]|uniref:3-beta hydroxysteroid dehydrogenase/isomerase domain-containing protein n=1 Tax=Clathrus columnatus TaxID=1419009 RepID=A0AAV5AE93_9AGAM|nr:hypothetical protein Clacol_006858 [Clathrus columnatus]
METYLVIGGCGFLGRTIVQALLARGSPVAVFDLVQRYFDEKVQYFTGDLTDPIALGDAIKKSGATILFHTASPHYDAPVAVHYKVNVDGTKTLLEVASANGAKCLVYTSSAGLIFNSGDARDIDERVPIPENPLSSYNKTKGIAEELVLEANGKNGLLTVAIRPSGIYGPLDQQGMGPGIAKAVREGQTKVQVGSNNNLTDWTYVDNVVKAHILAADRLSECTRGIKLKREEIMSKSFRNVSLTTKARPVPTSQARPLGPAVERPANADEIQKAWEHAKTVEQRRTLRSKYDQFSPASLASMEKENIDPFRVDGQAFIITNGEPMYFWDIAHAFMLGFGAPQKHVDHPPITIPKPVGHVFGLISEWLFWCIGKTPTFTSVRADYMCAARYYNYEKARLILGYEPDVGVKEGIERTIEWWKEFNSAPKS